jgi:hypothetical protein
MKLLKVEQDKYLANKCLNLFYKEGMITASKRHNNNRGYSIILGGMELNSITYANYAYFSSLKTAKEFLKSGKGLNIKTKWGLMNFN